MKFTSTRNEKIKASAAEAITMGLAPEGGLYVPLEFPRVSLDEFLGLDYEDLAVLILSQFLPEFDNLKISVKNAYADAMPVRLKTFPNKFAFLELFNGKSAAFKDVALQLLPHLLTTSLHKIGENRKAVVLTATSGDTGSAAMSGFSNVPQTEVIVFYPDEGISQMQRLQMTTQTAKNVHAVAVKGNFDDAQKAVKLIFQDQEFEKKFEASSFFSSANSINLGRLLPQIVYYFWAYSQLVTGGEIKSGEWVDFTVPTGNFGNILAGYYAKRMGLPIAHLICATNKNSVLYDVLSTGTYDCNRDFYVTNSPSMDILVSSNFERLIYHLGGAKLSEETQAELANSGKYHLPKAVYEELKKTFWTEKVDDQETQATIKAVSNESHYIIDPHTAVAYAASQKLKPTNYNVILATASPYKFADTVEKAIGKKLDKKGQPQALMDLEKEKVTQTKCVEKNELEKIIEEIYDKNN
ncbi:threonine synthase [Lactococcus fujiensis]|uniref:Threonine synthase n=1 Tax=Lactococcus fujiensis JCM 16395 TaxID=1291764 RepID=A0A2A5RPQ9_9LACT|nr:threonine synthase [Lactococcus fujiensis]PCS01406.1 threonine synthase [Lactococcus fujiensis JCM 16395]